MPRRSVSKVTLTGSGALQSLARSLAVMRCLGSSEEGVTISEAAERAEVTRAGARRILLTLMELGYVRQQGRYFSLTPKILDLGIGLYAGVPFWRAAEVELEQLCATLNETVSIAVLDNADILYVLRQNARRLLNLGIAAGSRLPAYLTSPGWVLLAALPEAKFEAYLRETAFETVTARTISDPRILRARLEATAKNGFAYVESIIEVGIAGLAVPIRDHAGRAIAAMSLSTRVGRGTRDRVMRELLPALRAAAERIEQNVAALPGSTVGALPGLAATDTPARETVARLERQRKPGPLAAR